MNELLLIEPTEEYLSQIEDYKKEFLSSGEIPSGSSSLENFDDITEWLHRTRILANENDNISGIVPQIQYLCIRKGDNRLVGMICLRRVLTDYLSKFAGNVGYSIRKSERRHGYGHEQLRLALEKFRILGMSTIIICCSDANEAAARVAISCGAIREGSETNPTNGISVDRYRLNVCKPGLLVQFPDFDFTCAEPLMLGCSDIFRKKNYEIIPLDYSDVNFCEDAYSEEILEVLKPFILERLGFIRVNEYADIIFISKGFGCCCAGWTAAFLDIHPRQLLLSPIRDARNYLRPDENILALFCPTAADKETLSIFRNYTQQNNSTFHAPEGADLNLKYPGDDEKTAQLNQRIFNLCK